MYLLVILPITSYKLKECHRSLSSVADSPSTPTRTKWRFYASEFYHSFQEHPRWLFLSYFIQFGFNLSFRGIVESLNESLSSFFCPDKLAVCIFAVLFLDFSSETSWIWGSGKSVGDSWTELVQESVWSVPALRAFGLRLRKGHKSNSGSLRSLPHLSINAWHTSLSPEVSPSILGRPNPQRTKKHNVLSSQHQRSDPFNVLGSE